MMRQVFHLDYLPSSDGMKIRIPPWTIKDDKPEHPTDSNKKSSVGR